MQQQRNASRRRRRGSAGVSVEPRFFIFLGTVVLAVVLIVCAVRVIGKGRNTYYTLGYGGYDQSARSYRALLVRQEQSYRSPQDGKVLYSIPEGQDVAAGTPILSLYDAEQTDQLLGELAQVRESIKLQQSTSLQGKIIDPQLDALEADVQRAVDAAVQVSGGGVDNLAQVYLALCDAMSARQEYIKHTGVAMAEPVLSSLYADETKLLGRIEQWNTAYAAPAAGRISYVFDNLETALTVQTVMTIRPDELTRILGGERPDVAKEILEQKPLYRLVDPSCWYAAIVVTPKDHWQATQGQRVSFTVDGYNTAGVTATVQAIEPAGDKSTVVLRMDGDIGSLISKRLVTMHIGERVEGLMAPMNALTTFDGRTCVLLEDGQTEVPVTVRAQDGQHCLIWPEQEGTLQKGDRILLR